MHIKGWPKYMVCVHATQAPARLSCPPRHWQPWVHRRHEGGRHHSQAHNIIIECGNGASSTAGTLVIEASLVIEAWLWSRQASSGVLCAEERPGESVPGNLLSAVCESLGLGCA
jgi:hypothetical protein